MEHEESNANTIKAKSNFDVRETLKIISINLKKKYTINLLISKL